MATQYATPDTSQAQIQAWLNALDYVVLSAGSQYDIVADQLANAALGLRVPAGATLDLNGAVVNFAAVLNQTADGMGAAAVGCMDGPCGVVRNGTVRAADNRVVPGQVPQHANALLKFRAVGSTWSGLVEDVELLNGPNQALQLNDVCGMTIRRLRTPRPLTAPTAGGVYLGHYVDLDVTARGRQTADIVFEECDLDAYGQDCLKLENCRNVRFRGTRFRSYLSICQDADDPYSELDDIEFDTTCTFESYVLLSHLRRRWNGSGVDSLGRGRVVLRGRMAGDDALIIGSLKKGSVGGTSDEQFANLRAEYMSFEGANSHLVPLPDSSWITGSTGVKRQVTVFARRSAMPHYPFAMVPCVVAGGVGPNTNLTAAVQNSLSPLFVAPYYLDRRGVRVSIAAGTWSGTSNLKNWPSLSQNVPVDFIGEGGSAGTVIDAEGGINACVAVSGTNNRRVRFIGLTFCRSKGGSSSRGWLVNNAAANVEFHDVVSVDCSCLNGGGGGRAQAYSRLVIGPGSMAHGCQALGASNGGGFLIDSSPAGVSEIEGARVLGCSAGGVGGGVRINSINCRVRSLELVNNSASAGAGGLAINVSSGTGTARISGVSGRGNAAGAGAGRDFAAYLGSSSLKVVFRSAVLGSSALVLSKTGSGCLEYGDLNVGPTGSMSVTGGVNVPLGNVQLSDPLFVGDAESVALSRGSPARGAAAPQWQVNVERVPVSFRGEWFQVTSAGMTTMGSSPV